MKVPVMVPLAQLLGWVGRALLVIAGVGLMALALMTWLNPEQASVSKVTETSTVTLVAPPAAPEAPTATIPQPQTPAAAAAAATTQTTTTTTEKTTETTTPPASKRSDLLITALLAMGAGSVLLGVFLDRIKSFKVAGIEVEFLEEKLKEKVATKLKPKNADQRVKTRLVYRRSLEAATALGVSPNDDAALDSIVDQVANSTFAGNPPFA